MREILHRIASERRFFDLQGLFVHVVGKTLESWKMWGVVSTDNGLVCEELVGVENLLRSLDESDLQPIGFSEQLTANAIHRTVRCLVGNQNLP